MNNIPRNIFVFIIAKISRTFDNLIENIWVITRRLTTKIPKYSKEKILNDEVMIKNQKENPAVTANALNRGEEISI